MNDGDKTDSLNIADITVEDELEVGDVDEGEVSVKQVMMFMRRINMWHHCCSTGTVIDNNLLILMLSKFSVRIWRRSEVKFVALAN